MSARTDFWLDLHNAANSLEAEGTTREERRENVVQSYLSLSAPAQVEVLRDLRVLLADLVDLEPLIHERAAEVVRDSATAPTG